MKLSWELGVRGGKKRKDEEEKKNPLNLKLHTSHVHHTRGKQLIIRQNSNKIATGPAYSSKTTNEVTILINRQKGQNSDKFK